MQTGVLQYNHLATMDHSKLTALMTDRANIKQTLDAFNIKILTENSCKLLLNHCSFSSSLVACVLWLACVTNAECSSKNGIITLAKTCTWPKTCLSANPNMEMLPSVSTGPQAGESIHNHYEATSDADMLSSTLEAKRLQLV